MPNDFERLEHNGQIAWKCMTCGELFLCMNMPLNHHCQNLRRTPIPGEQITPEIPPFGSVTPRSRFLGVRPPGRNQQQPYQQFPPQFQQPPPPLPQFHEAFIQQQHQMENMLKQQYQQQQEQMKQQQEQQNCLMGMTQEQLTIHRLEKNKEM